MSSERVDREERVEMVLCAAERVIALKGFASTTMEDISRASGLGMRSLYALFPCKERLFAAVAKRKAEEIRERVFLSVDEQETALGKVRAILQSVLAMRERNRELIRFYVFERHIFEWDIRSEIGEYFHNLYQDILVTIARLIEEGVARGEFKPIDPVVGAAVLMGGINTLTYLWIYDSGAKKLTEEGEKLWAFFLQALGEEE